MSARATLRAVLECGRDALPGAWQQDPIFRAAAIGLGVTTMLLLARLVGPSVPELQPQPYTSPMMAPAPGRERGASPATPQAAASSEMPKIAPGQSLNDVTVTPAVDGDRFGTFKPGTRP